MRLEELFLGGAVLGYAIVSILCIVFLFNNNKKISRASTYLLILSFIFHTISLAARIYYSGRLPLSNLYESLTSFAWGLVLNYFIFEKVVEFKRLRPIVIPIVFIVSAFALSLNKDIEPLMPALQSNWLTAHVLMAIVSYSAFTISFAAAVIYLIKDKYPLSLLGKQFPSLEYLDRVISRIILYFGFPYLTLLIITGAIWAEAAWGTYWSWDPKEVWSLITWLIYAVYLHARFQRGWKGKAGAYLAIIGFLAVIFTYLGVSFLLPGLHSYL